MFLQSLWEIWNGEKKQGDDSKTSEDGINEIYEIIYAKMQNLNMTKFRVYLQKSWKMWKWESSRIYFQNY